MDKLVELVKKLPPQKELKNLQCRLHFSKGINSGSWGTFTTFIIKEGDINDGVGIAHIQGTHPRVNIPHVRVSVKRKVRFVNGYVLPEKEVWEKIKNEVERAFSTDGDISKDSIGYRNRKNNHWVYTENQGLEFDFKTQLMFETLKLYLERDYWVV